MKRRYLLKHLGQNGCIVVREGRRHTIVKNECGDRGRIAGAETS
jgi:hypothetical protein